MLLTGQDSVRVRKTISRQRKNVILFADFSILKRLIRIQKIGAILSLFGLILRGIKFSEWHSCAFMLTDYWTTLKILAWPTDCMTNQPTDPFTQWFQHKNLSLWNNNSLSLNQSFPRDWSVFCFPPFRVFFRFLQNVEQLFDWSISARRLQNLIFWNFNDSFSVFGRLVSIRMYPKGIVKSISGLQTVRQPVINHF